MYTSITWFALLGSIAANASEWRSLYWHPDYGAAAAQCRRDNRPLAVVIGQGPEGWNSLSKEGSLDPEAYSLLRTHYICTYVDTDTDVGRRLADSFDVAEGSGLVLSDASGEFQAFRHQGKLSAADLERTLRRFSQPDRVTRYTESLEPEVVRPAYYPPPVNPIPSNFGSFSSRSC